MDKTSVVVQLKTDLNTCVEGEKIKFVKTQLHLAYATSVSCLGNGNSIICSRIDIL